MPCTYTLTLLLKLTHSPSRTRPISYAFRTHPAPAGPGSPPLIAFMHALHILSRTQSWQCAVVSR